MPHARLTAIVEEALQRQGEARERFLREACDGDLRLEADVRRLLAAEAASAAWFDDLAATVFGDVLAGGGPEVLPGQRLGHYVVRREIGRGGMGVVYLAHDEHLDRPVALKFLRSHLVAGADGWGRLEREARAAARLRHRAIATVYALERDGPVPFLVTEFLEGETLRSSMQRGPADPAEIRRALQEIAEGLAAAHREGIVHRDIKPDNLFRCADGSYKILDFGIAVPTTPLRDIETGTIDRRLRGTLGYMSPEQLRNEPLDGRSDLFSLGVVAYEWLAGRPPFDGGDPISTVGHILERAPVPLPELNAALDQGLSAIVHRLLEKRPADRYQRAEELFHALASDSPRPTPARPTLWWWQFHQGVTAAVYCLMLWPAWLGGRFVGGRLGLSLFVAVQAAIIVASSLRLHLWFTSVQYPARLPRALRPARMARAVAEWTLVGLFVVLGMLNGDAHPGWATLFIGFAIGAAVGFAWIEPATEEAVGLR